jgi:hypothetical protein
MKFLKFLAIILSLMFSSCERNEDIICDTKHPFRDIPNLKKYRRSPMIDSDNGIEVYKVIYNDQEVFLITPASPASDAMALVIDCNGEKVCEFGGYAGLNTCPDFEDNISYQELIWSR